MCAERDPPPHTRVPFGEMGCVQRATVDLPRAARAAEKECVEAQPFHFIGVRERNAGAHAIGRRYRARLRDLQRIGSAPRGPPLVARAHRTRPAGKQSQSEDCALATSHESRMSGSVRRYDRREPAALCSTTRIR